ncbi:MAG: T9SS type A sorting domain-containing protein [Bacteroidales bacterium]|nr:T9SS type A sorting domain-containing protein [Bacteroidales bacterium]
MKDIYILLIIGIVFLLPFKSAFSQESEEGWFRCGTDSVYDELVRKDPQVALNRAKLNDFVREYIERNPKRNDDEVYVIPVVFHVVHEYGVENISYEAVQAAVEQMNRDYRKMRDDTASIKEEFKPIAADTKIEFRLARKDPDGNCTMGITRTYSSSTNHGDEGTKYIAGSWDNSKYLNIWTVKAMSESGVAGYSYYPGTASDELDGIILLYSYIDKALTHEAGHYLNLPHPWGSTNSPGSPNNCDIDDGIEDTPNTIGHTSCALNAVTCGSLDNVQNFMDYSYCYRMFTNGQAAVMRATLNSTASNRNNLWTAENRIATGTDDDYIDVECPPIADFSQNKKMICTGSTVTYNDNTYNTTSVDYRLWGFQGGTPSTSSEEMPTITYNSSGTFTTELYVENSFEGNTLRRDGTIRVYDKSEGYSLPYFEGFESSSFPEITGNPTNDFFVENYNPNQPDEWSVYGWRNESWFQTASGYSGKCAKIRNAFVSAKNNKLYMPNAKIDSDSSSIYVSFKVAAAMNPDRGLSDILKVYCSTTCGDSLTFLHSYMGSRLITSYQYSPEVFDPDDDEWNTISFEVRPNKLNGQNFRLVFESSSVSGNTIYIDDVSISNTPLSVETLNDVEMSVYPNPFYDEIVLDAEEFAGEYSIEVYDIMGRMLYNGKSSEQHVNLSNAFVGKPKGMYVIKVYNSEVCKSVRVVKEA